jgi:hypothetical protein
VLASIPASASGYSIRLKRIDELELHLKRARAAVARHDFDTAENEFKQALQIDKSNQEAKTGFDAALSMLQKRNAFLQGLTDNGVWLDPKIPLLWTMKKSEHTMNWHAANDYCQTLSLDGLTGWRLPTEPELKSIYDPSVTKTKRSTTPGASTYSNMRGPIDVTGMVVFIWSSTMNVPGRAVRVWFDMGRIEDATLDSKVDTHALCIRAYQPATDGLDLPPATAPQSSAQSTDSNQSNDSTAGRTATELDATAKTPFDQLERQGETLFFKRQYTQAFPYATQSCDAGSQDGCALEAVMYGQGLGVARDTQRSVALANQSCDAGRARGCEALGGAYYLGSGVTRNFPRAAELFAASCKAGFPVACFDLGMQTLLGNGVTKDVPQAFRLLNQSCAGGYQQACDEARSLHNRGVN